MLARGPPNTKSLYHHHLIHGAVLGEVVGVRVLRESSRACAEEVGGLDAEVFALELGEVKVEYDLPSQGSRG